MTVLVDLAQVTAANAGVVDVGCRGVLPRLTAAAVEALACTADVRAVVCDGARPLATSQRITAAAIPEATRRAVEARDGGCRWAGCQAPLAHTEIHHLTPRGEPDASAGDHDPPASDTAGGDRDPPAGDTGGGPPAGWGPDTDRDGNPLSF